MAEGLPASDTHATSSAIPPLLRQRMLSRAATFAEGAPPPTHPSNRRRSSIYSEYSDTRHSLRSSTDNLLRSAGSDMGKRGASEESSWWHSTPLLAAILPAVGGLLFPNGSAIVTDVLLLGFGSMFLNYCVRAPWDWYYAAQRVQYGDPDEPDNPDTIVEEDNQDPETKEDDRQPQSEQPPSGTLSDEQKGKAQARSRAEEAAARQLARQEVYALIACFIGPLLGAYLLHTLRSYLSRPAEGLVSNFNLVIFLMAAEIRPVSHIIKMNQSKVNRLQRVVQPEFKNGISQADAQELSRRLAEVETRIADEVNTNSDVETLKISATVRQGLQPQLDALNRAVRRYEKRQAALTIQNEARLAEIDARMKDALSLAAAAARTGQRPGAISVLFTWTLGIIAYGFNTALAITTYPLRVAASLADEVSYLFSKRERQPRKQLKGQTNGHPSLPTPRIYSKDRR